MAFLPLPFRVLWDAGFRQGIRKAERQCGLPSTSETHLKENTIGFWETTGSSPVKQDKDALSWACHLQEMQAICPNSAWQGEVPG